MRAGADFWSERSFTARFAKEPLLNFPYEVETRVITVVSGLPRSGTSLMTQMIVAGGMSALTDGLRTADENNPKGYFEWEPAKSLKQNPSAIALAEGKVVKIISALLPNLPSSYEYRVVFMIRPLEEVVASQNKMLRRLGREVSQTPMAAVMAAFDKHLKETDAWLAKAPNVKVMRIEHGAVLSNPYIEAGRIAKFLGGRLDLAGMARQVEQSLYREKMGVASS